MKRLKRLNSSDLGHSQYAGRFSGLAISALLCIGVFHSDTQASGAPFTHRFVYSTMGMATKGIDSCIGRMQAAASLGYNGYITTCHEDNYLENVSQEYVNNVKRTVAEANRLNIALIPDHIYQGSGSFDDYSLSEAFPVRNTKFVVTGGEARAVQDHDTKFKNGDFEQRTGGKPNGWALIKMPSAIIETNGARSGNACLRISGGGEYARIQQNVVLKPFRAYRLSVWVKTSGFNGWYDARFVVTGSGPLLGKRARPFGTPYDKIHKGVWTTLSPNQGWRLCQTDFNSLKSTSASMEFTVSPNRGQQQGTIWLDDMKLEEVGLYETIRSRTRPIVVTSADGAITYKENVDYVVDPKCSKFTDSLFHYQGHLTIPQGSSIKEGQELRVSWYQLADVEQVYPETNFCMRETRDALIDNVQRMDKIYEHSKWFFIGFDEWRTAFWDDQCELYPHAKTAGEYMAGALRMSLNLLWGSNPTRECYMWNDMYDPYHNAWRPYAMTNGGCLNSWKDLDTNLIIINWRPGPHWDKMSLRFYMGIDDSLNPEGKVWRQILSVMDGARVGSWLQLVDEAEKEGGRGVIGISYVDWYANYSQMAAVKNACVARGRWGTGPIPPARRVSARGPSPQNKAITQSSISLHSPANGDMRVQYHIGKRSRVRLSVMNLQGRRVQTLTGGMRAAGTHTAKWDASSLSPGIYFIYLDLDGITRHTKKFVIL